MSDSDSIPEPDPVHMEPDDYSSKTLEPGQLLWHYTRDFAGLRGIIGGELWASSLPYLNDTQEFRYGVGIAVDTLKSLLEHSELTLQLIIQLNRRLLIGFEPNDIFSVSFSTAEDDLSQWRAYGGQGPAFALGFDPHKLELHALGYGFQLYEVKYEEADIAAAVKAELQGEADYLNEAMRENSPPQTAEEFARRQAPGIAGKLLLMAPTFKHPKFGAEEEWRLTRWMPPILRAPVLPRRFRLSDSLVVPYTVIPLPPPLKESEVMAGASYVDSPLVAITIGPGAHDGKLKYSIGDLTARCGLYVDVRTSEVPFRNW
jgi:hypothetical protein